MYFRGRQFLRFLYRKNKMPALFDVSVFLKKRSCIVGCIVRFSPVWFVVCSNVRITLFWSSQIQNYFTYSGFELSPRVEKKCSVLTWALMGLLWLSSNSSWVKVALQKGRNKRKGNWESTCLLILDVEYRLFRMQDVPRSQCFLSIKKWMEGERNFEFG